MSYYFRLWLEEAYSGPFQTSKMELFPKIINGWKTWPVFAQSSILNVCSLFFIIIIIIIIIIILYVILIVYQNKQNSKINCQNTSFYNTNVTQYNDNIHICEKIIQEGTLYAKSLLFNSASNRHLPTQS